jgi:hypothetical protein
MYIAARTFSNDSEGSRNGLAGRSDTTSVWNITHHKYFNYLDYMGLDREMDINVKLQKIF